VDKKKYLELRNQISFKIKIHFLFLHLLQDALLIAVSCLLLTSYAESEWVYLVIPIFATLMFRNFSLMHEAVHGVVSKNKMINDTVGVWAGGLCLLPFESWKQVHLEHHYWSGNIEKDPVMVLVRTFPNWSKGLQSSLGFLWKAWIPALALLQYAVFWWHSSLKFIKNPTSLKLLSSVIFPIVLSLSIFNLFGATQTLTLLIPAFVLYLLAVEVVNFPHHVGLPYVDEDHHLPVWDQHITARSCIYPAWLSKFIVLNFNYHIEHHMFPDAPWYYLPDLHQMVSPALKENYNTDHQFVWIKENRIKSLAQLFKTEQRLKDRPIKSA
jgi:acyl-lipid omega-6 desaturase (Delta-12 desaturase)